MKSKLPINQILTAVLLVTVLLMAFQNCSPTSFKQVDVASTAASASTPDPAAPPQQDIPVNNTLATPMYSLSIDPCLAGDDCVVHVTLDQTAAADFSFDWKTNDTAYLSNPALYAQPNVHYVPTQGTIHILKGQDETTLKIRSINWSVSNNGTQTMQIRITTTNCLYGAKVLSCKDIKQ